MVAMQNKQKVLIPKEEFKIMNLKNNKCIINNQSIL